MYRLFIHVRQAARSFFLFLFFFLSQNSYDEIMPMAIQISAYVKKHGPNRRSPQAFYSKIRNIAGRPASPVRIFSLCLFLLQRTFGQRRPYRRSIQSAKVPCNKIVRHGVRTNNATTDFVSAKVAAQSGIFRQKPLPRIFDTYVTSRSTTDRFRTHCLNLITVVLI